jgi:tetratricopeptide (TPR) repeat protein
MVAALLLALPAPLRADGSAHVLRVKQLFDQLYFKEALAACKTALEAGRRPRAELVQLLGYKALIAGSLGQEASAVEAFKQLLTIDPRAKLARGYAPRIRRAYEKAVAWVAAHGAIAIAVEAPATVARDGTLVLSAKAVKDPLSFAARGTLYLRASGEAPYTAHPASSLPLAWSLPLAGLRGLAAATALDYYLVVLDESLNEVALVGSAASPRRIALAGAPPALAVAPVAVAASPAPGERRRPLLRRWWFWTAIGVAVAATAVGVGVGVGARGDRDLVTAPVTLETGR